MDKIINVSVPCYRELSIRFESGLEGTITIDDQFYGVAKPLEDPQLFATAHSIDEGMAIGFNGTPYDICGEYIRQLISQQVHA